MSTDGSTNTSGQTPQQEVLERAAENFPTWQFPRMVGLVHLASSMAAARSRVNDSHKLQMKKLAETLGYDAEESKLPEDQDDGMFSVAGDTTINVLADPAKKSSGLGTLGTIAATVLGSGGIGAAAVLAWQLWNREPAATDKPDPPAIVQPADRDTTEGITIYEPPTK